MSTPPPVITSMETYAAGWCWWPPSVVTFQKYAMARGWQVRTGFARGYKPGQAKDTWALLDTIGVWLHRPGHPRVVFTWERSPDSVAGTWKATTASFRAGRSVRMYGHTAAKALLS